MNLINKAIAAAENDELASDWRKEPAQYAPVIRELVERVVEVERALSQILIHNDGESLKQAELVMSRQCLHQIKGKTND